MPNLRVFSKQIRQLDGLFSLNDLHKAAGGDPRLRPSNFIRNRQTQDLISSIEQSSNLSSDNQSPNLGLAIKTQQGGASPGTYVCRELVIAYAAWVSPDFHLAVIRVFLDQHEKPTLTNQFADSDKYALLNSMISSMGFESAPVVVDQEDLHRLITAIDTHKNVLASISQLSGLGSPDWLIEPYSRVRAMITLTNRGEHGG